MMQVITCCYQQSNKYDMCFLACWDKLNKQNMWMKTQLYQASLLKKQQRWLAQDSIGQEWPIPVNRNKDKIVCAACKI